MTYTRGLLKVGAVCPTRAGSEVNDCECELEYHADKHLENTVYLPHRCAEWIIGGEAEVEDLIADLKATLK